jgi:N-acetylglutamate synthase-like GNAT family acetyltransferase
MIQIRKAEKSEIEWINQCYDQINFAPSNFEQEIIAIALLKGQATGLGRLITIDDKNLELGGIYTFEAYRGQGVAREIVEFLLKQASLSQTIYCIPFEHLRPFYQSFGFIPCKHTEQLPKKILDKYFWCKQQYTQPTTLLYRS